MSPLAGLATLFACGSEPNGTLADYDKDDDGSAISEGDCNDLDPAIGVTRPDAEGDGIDSDCDGSDGSLLRLTEVAVAIYHGGTLGGAFGHQVVAGPDLDSDGLGEFAVLASEVYAPQPAGGTVFVLSFAGTGEHSLTQDDALIVIVDSSEEIDDIAFVTPLAGGRLAAACNTPDNIAGMDGGVGLYCSETVSTTLSFEVCRGPTWARRAYSGRSTRTSRMSLRAMRRLLSTDGRTRTASATT